MIPSRHAIYRLRQPQPGHRSLYLISLLIFFWIVFDGIVSYIFPILATERGYSQTAMGMILASSSVFGFVLDVVLTKTLRHTNYLRIFLYVLLLSLTFPLFLWFSTGLTLFLVSMFIWGLYWDLYDFAVFDYVSSDSPPTEHCFSFGIIEIFKSVGLFVAPLIAGLLVAEHVSLYALTFPLIFLFAAFGVYALIVISAPQHHFHAEAKNLRSPGFRHQLSLLSRLGHSFAPFLLITVILNIFDASVFTIGPLFSYSFPGLPDFGGFFLALYNLPALLTVWKIESIVDRFGKAKTAFVTFFLSCLFLIPIGLSHQPYIILLCIFVSSIFSNISWPAFNGLYADFIQKNNQNQKEMEGLNDMATNIGYIIGPMIAGFLSQSFNVAYGFSAFSLISLILMIAIYFAYPSRFQPTK